jgi:hypothetical protein
MSGSSTQQVLLAGGGTPSTPPLTNLWGWWFAHGGSYTEVSGTPTTLISADGTAIGSLKDQSGNARHFYRSASPTYKTGILNGLSIARFSGASQYMAAASMAATPVSVYAVALQSTFNGAAMVISGNNNLPTYGMEDVTSAGGGTIGCFYGNGGAGANTPGITIGNATWFLCGITLTGVSASETLKVRVNAGSDQSNAVDASGSNSGNFLMGAYNGSIFWIGDIAEVLAYTGTVHNMGSGDGLLVRQYLNLKYGLGLAI